MNASDADWKFVALHKAPYSNGSHYDDDDVIAIRAQRQALMPQLGIDIVFQGHDHVFMRTDVMNNNKVVEAETESITYNGLDYTAKVNPDGTIYSINGTIGVKHYKAKPVEDTNKLFPLGEAVMYLEVPSYTFRLTATHSISIHMQSRVTKKQELTSLQLRRTLQRMMLLLLTNRQQISLLLILL